MIIKVQNETPFQVLTGAFTLGPSQTGYELQVGATSDNFTTLFSVGANTTRMVTNVANGSYYRLKNNVGEVSVNWSRTCVTPGGSGGAGNELTPVTEFPIGAEAGTVVALASGDTYGIYQYDGTDWNEAGADVDLSAYWTSAETQSAITAVEGHLFDVEQVTASALTELHDGLMEVSGRTGGSGNIVELTQQEYDNLSAYSPDTLYVISDATPINMDNYVESGDVATQIAAAVSGKADAVSVSPNTSDKKFPYWNEQGIITGDAGVAVQDGYIEINGQGEYPFCNYGWVTSEIFAPTSAGSEGQPLLSAGSGAPVWANYKFAFLTQTQYDNLATKDASTIYFIIG